MLCQRRQLGPVVSYVTHLHIVIDGERNGNYVFPVEFAVDDAAGDGVAVKPDKAVEERCPVAHANVLGCVVRRLYLLLKVEGIVLTLLECKAGVGFKLFQSDAPLFCQRVVCAYEHMRLCRKQRREL